MRRFVPLLVVGVVGCHSSGATKVTSAEAVRDCDPARDRAAILRMAGTFDVTFDFEETDVLTPGYERRPASVTDAREVVLVLDDSERSVSLQHVLLLRSGGGEVMPQKHWRQDWRFEDTRLLEFKGKGTWERRDLPPAAVQCAWSQSVFEVTDAPRYESVGRWKHDANESAWTSERTWRPLPRREYTKRSDYDVLIGTNRHVVAANGWRHEQDNVKHVLASGSDLVRERGLNRYVRAELAGADEVRTYMRDRAQFWSAVRAEWAELEAKSPRLSLAFEVEGKQLYEHLFPLSDELRASPPAVQRSRAHEAIAPYVTARP
jgi:hypothetical protein